MRISAAVPLFLAACRLAGASPLDRQSAIVDTDLKIPGDSPLELCPKEHDEDIITIESVDLLPNPPQACVRFPAVSVLNVASHVGLTLHV